MKKRWNVLTIAMILLAAVVAGCNTDAPSSRNTADGDGKEPITLEVYTQVPISEEDWEKLIVNPVSSKFPHITLNRTERSEQEIEELIAAGYVPDMLFTGFYFMGRLLDLNIPASIEDRIKGDNVDLTMFEQVAVDSLRDFSSEGVLLGLPIYMNTTMLFYNKEIFDLFGVDYPNGKMSWEESLVLARQLTRTSDGVQYAGLMPGSWDTLGSQLTVQKINPESNAAQTEAYKPVFEFLKANHSIPGMEGQKLNQNRFFQDRTIAMNSYWLTDAITNFQVAANDGSPMNWDMVPTPYFQEREGVGSKVDAHILMVSAQSKHQEEVFQIIHHLTTDQEVQAALSKAGRMPIIVNDKTMQQYGADYPVLEGKNKRAVFETTMAPLHLYHELENELRGPLNEALNKVLEGTADINSALREAKEKTDAQIAAQLGE